MTWLVAGASLFATWLNIRACFAIWFGTSLTCFTHDLPAQGCLMTVYAGLAVWGFFAWGKRDG